MTELERNALRDLDIERPWSLIETFSTMPRVHPEDANRAADVITERLRAAGLTVTVHEPMLYLSLPLSARVQLGEVSFHAKAPSRCADARNGRTAELVYVPADYAEGSDDIFDTLGDGTADAAGVEGKIVLTEGFAGPANVAHFEARGAVGLIAINPGADAHWGTCSTIWGNPGLSDLERTVTIPAVSVNRPDGEALREAARDGTPATVFTEMEEGWYRSKVPEVRIEGREEPDRFVLLHGHYDSWDVGVADNATGDATLAEVARVLWAHRDGLRRSVRIAWWPGHSTGRYAGSTWYADAFAVDLAEQCVAQVNCDSPGARWATVYEDVSLTRETEPFAAGVIHDAVGQELHAERAHQAGDYSFNNIGISSYFMLLSTMPRDLRVEKGYYAVGGCGGNIAWHTENDTLEIADREILAKDLRIYLLATLRNANAPVLPFDWRATTATFREALARYAAAAGPWIDLRPVSDELDALDEALTRLYDASERGQIEARAASDAIQDLARILVPIDYTQHGAFRHDPALTIPPLPDLAPCERIPTLPSDHTRRFLATELLRGRNRVQMALRDARRRVARTVPRSDPEVAA